MCSFRMWWTTAAALKACWGDTRPVSDRLHPQRASSLPSAPWTLETNVHTSHFTEGSRELQRLPGDPKESPPPQLPQPSLQGPDGLPASWRGQLTLHLLLAKFFWIWRLTDG